MNTFTNISDRYGNDELVTLADYQDLNPDAIFEIRGDEIVELDFNGEFVEVVAVAN